jgi:hypothetical protein
VAIVIKTSWLKDKKKSNISRIHVPAGLLTQQEHQSLCIPLFFGSFFVFFLFYRPSSHWGDATAIRLRKNHFTVAYWSNLQFVMVLLPPARPRCDDYSPWIKCSRLFSWSNRSRVASVGERTLKVCDNGWFIIGTLCWTMSIVWCIFVIHDVSKVASSPVLRWLVVIILTLFRIIRKNSQLPERRAYQIYLRQWTMSITVFL